MTKARKKRMGKLLVVLLVFATLAVGLTACQSSSGGSDDERARADKENGAPFEILDPSAPEEARDLGATDETMLAIGDEIHGCTALSGALIPDAIIYKITKAEMFDTPEAAGIEQGLLSPQKEGLSNSDFDENGNVKPQFKFLLIEATVKNLQAAPEQNISSLKLVCKDKESNGFFEMIFRLNYFSHASRGAKDYYNYQLPVGEVKNLKFGYYFDTESYDTSDLYLAVGVANKDGKDSHLVFVKLF
jgi:hypothetical protein